MPFSKNFVRVEIPKNSGFSLKHRNSGSLRCGTITPLLVEEIIPNARVSCKIPIVHQLPPLASDTYMNVKVKVEAFFVPFRILQKGYESFFDDFPVRFATFSSSTAGGSGAAIVETKGRMPYFHLADDVPASYWGPGTLLDYLGFMVDNIQLQTGIDINCAAIVAYHLIWQEYYRNPKVQNPCFVPDIGASNYTNTPSPRVMCIPYMNFYDAVTGVNPRTVMSFDASTMSNADLADGVNIFSLRQRNFGFDFYTNCNPSPQQGAAATVVMPVSGSNATATIAQIRAANSLQQFRERNNISSPRFIDQIRARYGANLPDGVAQRPICIGSASYDVVTRGIDQTAGVNASASANPNPFNNVAAQYGRAYGAGSDFIIDDFTANEPGLIFVNQTLVPEVTYSTGIRPYLRRYLASGSIVEMANPILQNVGDEPVDAVCLDGDVNSIGTIFGYSERYGSFMFHPNECHGQLRDGQTLQSFVLQRSFNTAPSINSSFLEIPTSYLDQAFAVSSGITNISAWYDALIELNVSMPLAEYSIPSLQDPAYEHGNSVNLRRNGQIF